MSSDDTIADLLMISHKSLQLSSEPEEIIKIFVSIYWDIPNQMEEIWLFHMFNNLVFGGYYSVEEISNKIYAFMIKKRHLCLDLWEYDFYIHKNNLKRNGFWGTIMR